jgi:hypothetical protein
MTPPKITPKQQTILQLIYKHRFIERTQIQQLLGHTHRGHSNEWLKDLRQKHYIDWIYQPDSPIGKLQPAIYYLALDGIRYLRDTGSYPPEELRKRYKEPTRTRSYIDRCVLLVDCCINLQKSSIGNANYAYATQAEYAAEDNEHNFLTEIGPHLCYKRQREGIEETFLVEVIDSGLPHYQLRKRLKEYVDYVTSGDYEEEMSNAAPPIVSFICPSLNVLIYAKRRVRQLLADIYDSEDEDDARLRESIHLRFTTLEKIRLHGITGKIWEEA